MALAVAEHREAEAAIVAVARRHGLDPVRPVVLKEAHALVLRLDPWPVVGRAPVSVPPERRSAEWRERERAVVEWLLARGVAVAPPADALPPGPHVEDGHVVTFWRLLDHDPERPLDEVAAGRALRRIEDALAHFPGDVGGTWYLDDLDLAAREGNAPVEARGLLRRAHDRGSAAIAGARLQPVHGDPSIANCFRLPDGPLWSDFEDTCVAPLEWEAACLVAPRVVHGPHPDAEAVYAAAFPDYDEALLDEMIVLRIAVMAAWTILIRGHAPPRLEPWFAWLGENV